MSLSLTCLRNFCLQVSLPLPTHHPVPHALNWKGFSRMRTPYLLCLYLYSPTSSLRLLTLHAYTPTHAVPRFQLEGSLVCRVDTLYFCTPLSTLSPYIHAHPHAVPDVQLGDAGCGGLPLVAAPAAPHAGLLRPLPDRPCARLLQVCSCSSLLDG